MLVQHGPNIPNGGNQPIGKMALAYLCQQVGHGHAPNIVLHTTMDRCVRNNFGTPFRQREIEENARAPGGPPVRPQMKSLHRPRPHAAHFD